MERLGQQAGLSDHMSDDNLWERIGRQEARMDSVEKQVESIYTDIYNLREESREEHSKNREALTKLSNSFHNLSGSVDTLVKLLLKGTPIVIAVMGLMVTAMAFFV